VKLKADAPPTGNLGYLTRDLAVNHKIFDNWADGVIGVGAASQLLDYNRRTIFVADAHRGDGKRFVVRADEKLNRKVPQECRLARTRVEISEKAPAHVTPTL
jgi:hypothetical protein